MRNKIAICLGQCPDTCLDPAIATERPAPLLGEKRDRRPVGSPAGCVHLTSVHWRLSGRRRPEACHRIASGRRYAGVARHPASRSLSRNQRPTDPRLGFGVPVDPAIRRLHDRGGRDRCTGLARPAAAELPRTLTVDHALVSHHVCAAQPICFAKPPPSATFAAKPRLMASSSPGPWKTSAE